MRTAATSLQQQSWISTLGDQAGARAVSLLVKLAGDEARGDQAPRRIREVLRALVRRHDALRMCFSPDDPQRCGVIDPDDADVEFEVADSPPDEDEIDSYLTRPFALAGPTRVRARLIPVTGGGWLLALAADHLTMDFVSLQLALRGAMRRAARPPQYTAFTALQREQLAGSWGTERTAFWLRYFDRWGAGYAPAPLARRPSPPPGHAWTGHADGQTVRYDVPVDDDLRAAIVGAAAARGTSPFGIFATAVLVAQVRWDGASTAGIVTDFHGRVFPAARTTVGLFSHGARIHVAAEECGDLNAAAGLVAGRIADLRTYGLPLRLLADDWCRNNGVPQQHPPYVYVCARPRRRDPATAATGDLSIRGIRLRTAANEAGRDLSIILVDGEDGLALNVRFSTAVFDRDDVGRFLASTFDVVRGLAATWSRLDSCR